MYILLAMLGTISLTISFFIRGITSSEPFAAKLSLSSGFFILAIIVIIFSKIRQGSNFRSPWQTAVKDSDTGDEQFKFSAKQFIVVFIGGLSEFLTSYASILSLGAAKSYNINLGVSTSIATLDVVSVTILSYLLYNQRINIF